MGIIIENIYDNTDFLGVPFVLELNEATTNKHKYSIHIQNEKFRVEFDEVEFLQYLALIKHANNQFQCIKKGVTNYTDENVVSGCNVSQQYVNGVKIEEFFELLSKNHIEYLLLYNHCNELPNRLVVGKDIDILVSVNDKEDIDGLLQKNGYIHCAHPLGKHNNYKYLYNMIKPEFWENEEGGYKVDIHFQLGCQSLTPLSVVPLDKRIEEYFWKNRFWDDELHCWRTSKTAELVYTIIRGVFDKHSFSEKYKEEILKNKLLLMNNEVKELLHMVFYSFTNHLVEMIMKEDLDNIFIDYIKNYDY